jgi:uncharacterized protein YlxW (UPF0749 family)
VRLARPSFKKWQLPLTLVLFLFGLLLILALRSLASGGSALLGQNFVNMSHSDIVPREQNNSHLITMIKAQEQENADMEAAINARRTQLNAIRLNATSGKQAVSDLQKQVQQLEFLAGFTQVRGPGLLVSLDDNRKGAAEAQANNPGQFKAEDYLIHYTHLLYIVNELRVGGAEAISINDQRIEASSDIRCAGPLILVNTTRLAPPYIIRAIGNPGSMTQVLKMPDSEYNILKMAGYPVSLESSPLLLLPAYQGAYQFSYATP